MCGVKTNIVTSGQVTDGYLHDYSFFKPLVDSTAKGWIQDARGLGRQGLSRRV